LFVFVGPLVGVFGSLALMTRTDDLRPISANDGGRTSTDFETVDGKVVTVALTTDMFIEL
jgi:hypothetical protein